MPDSPTHVELFGTIALAALATTGQILFAGADGFGTAATSRLMPPPAAGIVKRVVTRTISLTGDPSAAGPIDYFLRLYATRVSTAVPGNASRAVWQIGQTLAPLIPLAAVLADALRTDPDLSQYVEWPYILQDALQIAAPDTGAVPFRVPGLLVTLDCTAIPADTAALIGVGILVESRVPGYPSYPLIQRGGTSAGASWPTNA